MSHARSRPADARRSGAPAVSSSRPTARSGSSTHARSACRPARPTPTSGRCSGCRRRASAPARPCTCRPTSWSASRASSTSAEPLITPVTNGLGAGLDAAAGDQPRHPRDPATPHQRAALPGARPAVAGDRRGRAARVGARAGDRMRSVGVDPVFKHAATELGVCSTYVMGLDDDVSDPIRLTACGEAAHPSAEVSLTKALLEFANSRARKAFFFGRQERVRRLGPPAYWAAVRGRRRPPRRSAGAGGAAGLGRARADELRRADRSAPGPHRRLPRHRGAGLPGPRPAKRTCWPTSSTPSTAASRVTTSWRSRPRSAASRRPRCWSPISRWRSCRTAGSANSGPAAPSPTISTSYGSRTDRPRPTPPGGAHRGGRGAARRPGVLLLRRRRPDRRRPLPALPRAASALGHRVTARAVKPISKCAQCAVAAHPSALRWAGSARSAGGARYRRLRCAGSRCAADPRRSRRQPDERGS